MKNRRIATGLLVMVAALFPACFDDKVVAPDEPLPPELAVNRPRVQLLRYAMGRKVESDTVRITNNGEGPLGRVLQVGGVAYLTTDRVGWLNTEVVNTGTDEALLILRPIYADEEQAQDDLAEVVLKAEGSPELRYVTISARTLPGASFEFSVSPVVFAAGQGDPASSQRITVRNGGNGSLTIYPPAIEYEEPAGEWLTVARVGGTEKAPEFELRADPGAAIGGGIFSANLLFSSPETEETRAKSAGLDVKLNVGQPQLGVSASTLGFTVVRGASDPSPQRISVSNVGAGPFSALGTIELGPTVYGAGTEEWLEVELAGSGAIVVSAITGGLAAGVYGAEFSINSQRSGSQRIQVALYVEAPVLTPSSRTVSFGMVEGDLAPPLPVGIRITNTGSGPPDALGEVSLGTPTPPADWLSTSLIENQISFVPTQSSTNLTEGRFSTRLPVESTFGGSDTVGVLLVVSRGVDEPTISLSSTAIDFTGVRGDQPPLPQSVLVANSGGGSLGAISVGTIGYNGGTGWLKISTADSILTLTPSIGTLGAGVHVATVPVMSAFGGSASIEVTFTLGVPTLTASTSSGSFTAPVGGTRPAPQVISLSNTGPGSFSSLGSVSLGPVIYSGSPGWLSPSLSGQSLTLSVVTVPGADGTYRATVPVRSAEGGDLSIDVTLTVIRAPEGPDLVASPGSIRMDAILGGPNPGSQAVILTNGGGGSLGALSLTESSPWLTTSGPGPSVTLIAQTGGLSAGTYTASVVFSSANGGHETVQVTLVVSAAALTLSSASASFYAVEGGGASPASISVTIMNTGAGDFGALGNVTLGAIAGSGWLQASLPGGGNTITLTVDPSGLGVGTYSGTVPVNSSSGGNAAVDVRLTVTPTPEDPVLRLSSAEVSFFAEEAGGDPDPQSLWMSNGGGGGFSALTPISLGAVNYGGGASGWLTRGIVGQSLSLEVDTGTIPAGTHQATFSVMPGVGPSRSVTVRFTVSAALGPTSLELGTSSVSFSAVRNGDDPPQREVAVLNGGSGDLGNIDVNVASITYVPNLPASRWLEDTSHSNSAVTLVPRTGTLAPGTYTASVPVVSNNGGARTLAVTFSVESSVLSLTSGSVSFSASEGGGNPAAQSVGVFNSGAGGFGDLGGVSIGPVAYVPPGTGWLTPTLVSETLTLRAATGSLPPGVYVATVPVSSVSGGSESLRATFTVRSAQRAADLVVSPATVQMNGIQGGSDPPSQTVLLANAGGGELGILGVTETASWLSTSGPGTSVTLTGTLGGLAAGIYVTTVEFSSGNGGSESVDVSLTVARPILTLSTQGVSFRSSASEGPPPIQAVQVSNTGAGTLGNLGGISIGGISYGPGASGWLVKPSTGSAVLGGRFDIQVDPGSLAPGSYTATVPVISQNGGEQSVVVHLSTVRETDPPAVVVSPESLQFGALVGGMPPDAQLAQISNAGGGTLGEIQLRIPDYGPGASGWLDYSLAERAVSVRAIPAGLEKGSYTAVIPVETDQGGSAEVGITLNVGSPRVTLAPRSVSFGDTVGGSGPPPGTVGVANTGGGTFGSLGEISLGEPLYEVGASAWLSASAEGNSLSLVARTGELQPRTEAYTALLPVFSQFGGADTVAVSFSVTPGATPPRLALSADSVTFDGIFGGVNPNSQTVSAFNSGGGTLGALSVRDILYEDPSQGWLSSFVDGESLRFVPTIEGLSAGLHRARVVVGSEHGGEVRLETFLDIAQPVLSLSSGTITFSDTVGSQETLRSKVFLSNTGGGDRSSLGALTILPITYPEGESGWLLTSPAPGEAIGGELVELEARGGSLEEGTSVALVQIQSQWGGARTVSVTFSARKPDRSFDLPTIEFVGPPTPGGSGVLIPLPGDSVVVRAQVGATGQIGFRVGVRNGSETRVTLSGLRVGVPSYRAGQSTGWITGAFLDRTTATFTVPAELSVAVSPASLSPGRYEATLTVSSERAGLDSVKPRSLRVVLVVETGSSP